jgi:hypothetical protein
MKAVTKTSQAIPAVEQLNLNFESRAKPPKEAASPKRLVKRLRTASGTLENPKE